MENVLDTYERPYDSENPVVCMDEKSVQFHGEVREPLPVDPGRVRRTDTEYTRDGTGVMLVYVEPLTGRTYVSTRRRRTALNWAETVEYLLTKVFHLYGWKSSNPAEKVYDLTVAEHKRHGGANWPCFGSCTLASVSAVQQITRLDGSTNSLSFGRSIQQSSIFPA